MTNLLLKAFKPARLKAHDTQLTYTQHKKPQPKAFYV